MAKKRLATPDWNTLSGGGSDDKWQDDRLRKFGWIKAFAPAIAQMQDNLAAEGALYRCTPRVLMKYPSSAEWYVALACFAGKTLKNLQQRAKDDFGLSILPERLIENMEHRPDAVSAADLAAFSEWINAELVELIGTGLDEERLAGLHVAMIAGGRIIGQGQNEGGELAVAMLKQGLVDHFGPETDWRFCLEDGKTWGDVETDLQTALTAPQWFHKPSETLFDFRAGGNRPDVKATRDTEDQPEVLLSGEVKGRKDLSNTWESWIPQVNSHMESWATSFPDAYRGAFMTVFTEEMISGKTPKSSEERRGLRKLYEDGMLDFAINLSLLTVEEENTVARFKELFGLVLRVRET